MISARDVAARVDEVRDRISRAGGDPTRVTIVGVTKGFGREEVEAAADAGLVDLGENYAQELEEKAAAAPGAIRWHFLGLVQRNKVARLAGSVAVWHGIDRLAAGSAVAARAPGATVLVQVNLTEEPQRNGCRWDNAGELVDSLRELPLDVAGLMGVASRDPAEAEEQFERLAQLRDQLRLRELSIGMTDDFELAVRAGSTMVRVGRAIFGARPTAAQMRR